MLATPRFRASSHVIFFVLAKGGAAPLMIAKVPRLPGDHTRLDREAHNLRAGFDARPGGFDSIPRVLAYEEYCGHKLLIETAISGQPLKPAFVRHRPAQALEAVVAWLLEFHLATARRPEKQGHGFASLVEEPIQRFRQCLPFAAEEESLLARTLDFVQPLRTLALPFVLSHEDLSHPNILISPEGKIGVVDWELAESHGLPALDLFFYLNYLAFACHAADKSRDYLAAFQKAFFGAGAWSRPHVERYQARLNLPAAALQPLFVLCWLRYLSGLVLRLHDGQGAHRMLNKETLSWLRRNRYYLLWRYALDHVKDLSF